MKTTKRHITLLEIMIVIFLISIIGAAIGYNMKGSLERGKAFKTEQAISQINDILLLEAEKNDIAIKDIPNNVEKLLENSGLVKNAKALMKDGWGKEIVIKTKDDDADVLEIYSDKLTAYRDSHTVSTTTETPAKEEKPAKKPSKSKSTDPNG